MACAIPPAIDAAAFAGAPAPAGLDDEEKYSFEHVSFFYQNGLGYAIEMGKRPQTLYGLQDSPVALAAWIIDHDIWTYRQIARVFDGETLGLTRDDILDNITLYWLTRTGVSSARLYWENKTGFFAPKGVKIPVVVSAFPEEICPCPRKWAEKAYPGLLYYKKHPEGAHFAAWEQPAALVEDLRAGFKTLR
jgi:pimeloyl-ACP methyl ester carboxylesterase